jgi:hypothetical protein
LAITEPSAGSDVAALRCSAKREGEHFVVNGNKKFITGGCKVSSRLPLGTDLPLQADYYVVAVRTGGKGMFGKQPPLRLGDRSSSQASRCCC